MSAAEFVTLKPSEIIVNQDLRGRHFAPDKKAVERRAESMKTLGQLEAVGVYTNEDGKYVLAYGYTRHAAASLKGLPLECKVIPHSIAKDPVKLFLLTAAENHERNATTPVDDAFNQKHMRGVLGMTNVEIAKHYGGISGAWVGQLAKLTTLSEKILKQVANGEISVQAAIELAKLPPEKQEAAAEKAEAQTAKLGATKGKSKKTKISAKAAKKAAKGSKTEKGGSTPLRGKDVWDFFQSLTGPVEKDSFKEFAKKTMGFVAGKISEKTYEKYLREVFKAPLREPAAAE